MINRPDEIELGDRGEEQENRGEHGISGNSIQRLQPPLPGQWYSPHIHDDDNYTTVSSPTFRTETVRSVSPLLMRPQESELSPPTEPPPSHNPPDYRSVVFPPAYSTVWRTKYAPVGRDLEANRRPKSFGLAYYGWRVWAAVVVVIILTIVSIVVGLTVHA